MISLYPNNHYDHLNRFTIRALGEKAGHFIVPRGVDRHLKAWGAPMVRPKTAAKAAGVQIATPVPGQTTTADSPGSPWWEGPMKQNRNKTQ